ncbi:MAG TPA: DUF4037 domain-containing protein [Streptosporangiaceae bacterium]
MTMPGGAELARQFHAEVVGPLLARDRPGLRYAAGRLGSGSDVLGYDDEMSRDHDWGCRLTLLVDEADRAAVPGVTALLEDHLPETFAGLPVRFRATWQDDIRHQVCIATVADFAVSRLGVDPTRPLSVTDWLILDSQAVLEITAGPVFADRTTALRPARAALRWYPADVERYVLAAGWRRIEQQLPFVGRTAGRGDELGSRLLSAQLAGDVVALAFLVSRQWAPYAKWRGTALAALPVAGRLRGPLDAALTGASWREREEGLAVACEVLLAGQRERGLPGPAQAITMFWDRPYRTVDLAVAESLLAGITDPAVRRLPGGAGSAAQWIDSVDVLASPSRRAALASVYQAWSGDRDGDEKLRTGPP